MAIEKESGHEKYDLVFGKAVCQSRATKLDATTTTATGAITMTFDEWLDAYFSGTQIDDVVAGMMRTAFEAGESCSNSYNEQHELLGVASELCYRVEADMPTLRDKFAMAALQGMLADSVLDGAIDSFAVWAYKYADAMLKERVR